MTGVSLKAAGVDWAVEIGVVACNVCLMKARAKYIISFKCPQCGREGIAHVSKDKSPFRNSGFFVDNVAEGFAVRKFAHPPSPPNLSVLFASATEAPRDHGDCGPSDNILGCIFWATLR